MLRAKPSAAKGRYLKKVTFTTTMGPGIPVDPNRTKAVIEDAARLTQPIAAGRRSDVSRTAAARRLRWPSGSRW